MTTLLFTYGLPLLSALVAGALIGLEREWRGRAAGFRTHILVCLSSTLLMLASTSQGAWMFSVLPDQEVIADPTRMAHGILTGIGFLCAGVIFRAGFSIHGLTTAASLWTVSALGILFGAGLFWLGWAGALATLAILAALKLISRSVPERTVVDVEVRWPSATQGTAQAVEEALTAGDAGLKRVRLEMIENGQLCRQSWRLTVRSRDLAGLAGRIQAVPGVTGYDLAPRDD
ncbi:MgtC/SapB family protein [Brevundimonas halotolerans]|uniref:Protein MgtC n=1 Tax=Brevundimonas halotolerans TaxID=69670 RepID=A0A7W9A4T9_9CAUL|nr:MgtC/SapB family protein [Brevundimonas halotolerans]MBB5661247.1 putative Mg2+ transporter-C (MgtC) family protein [Brevundimonas halotolerans]